MNRADLTKEIARREALAGAWTASAKGLREQLEKAALAEYQEQGHEIRWPFRDLGKVVLPVSTEAPVVTDIKALLKWCKEFHPEHVETIEQVAAAFQTFLIKYGICDGDVVVEPETGQIIPGLGVREGGKPKSLTITVDRPVKDLFAQYAAAEVERQLEAEFGPTEPEPEPVIRCLGCGRTIRDGEPIEMIGAGYAHTDPAHCVDEVSDAA